MARANTDVIRGVYDAWIRRGPGAFDALDPEIEVHPDPEAFWVGVDQVYRGHEGLREYLRAVNEAFEDYRPEVEDFLEVGDKVVTLAIEHGRGRDSGAEVRSERTAHVWTMREGTAVRLDLYIDRDRALEALGLQE
jgi:ketosteroid isomerase-like protein